MEKVLIRVKLKDLIPYENNPRKNKKAVSAVAESIEQSGYNNPIIVDENMVILAGHTRRLALMKQKADEVEVLQVFGLTEEQKRKYRLLDNKVGEYASWDFVALMEEVSELDWEEVELDWGICEKPEKEASKKEKKETEEEATEYTCPECGFVFYG
jgi:ParB-like chromosome segregation protein Spo0J